MIRSPISHSCLSHYMRASCCSHSMQQLRGKRILSKNSPNRFSHWCQMEKELRRGDEEEVDDKEEVDKEDGGESQRTSETATETVPVLYSNYFLGTATTTPVLLLEGISTASIASNTLASSTTPTAFSTTTDSRNHHIPAPLHVNYQYQLGILTTQTPQPVP